MNESEEMRVCLEGQRTDADRTDCGRILYSVGQRSKAFSVWTELTLDRKRLLQDLHLPRSEFIAHGSRTWAPRTVRETPPESDHFDVHTKRTAVQCRNGNT